VTGASGTTAPGGPSIDGTPGAAETGGGSLTRRALLSRLAKIGVATAALSAGGFELVSYRQDADAATSAQPPSRPAHAWCMVIDLRSCDGCEACTMSCQQRHQLESTQTWIKVYSMTDAAGGTFHMPRPCMMCEDPPCMYVCPVGATFRTDEGLVLVDQNVCIGCRTCMAACPYEARYFNWHEPPPVKRMPTPPTPEMPVPQRKGTVGKCVLCADRLPHGELPACVAGCPMGVLYIGDLVTDVAVNGLGEAIRLSQFLKDNDAVRFKEELGTNPRVYYILGHGQEIGGAS
jgi:dimethyl sulfoxide reductase iron-sulfur subunit